MSTPELPSHVFKAYDIRGEVPEDLNPDFAMLLGRSLAARAKAASVQSIVIGFDGRLSSPALAQALSAGIREGGIHAIELGMVPTPLVYFAAHHLGTGSGVAITGSHNPPQYNGFKMMLGGSTLYGQSISDLRQEMGKPKAVASTPGELEPVDIKPVYAERVAGDIKTRTPHENSHRLWQWRGRCDRC